MKNNSKNKKKSQNMTKFSLKVLILPNDIDKINIAIEENIEIKLFVDGSTTSKGLFLFLKNRMEKKREFLKLSIIQDKELEKEEKTMSELERIVCVDEIEKSLLSTMSSDNFEPIDIIEAGKYVIRMYFDTNRTYCCKRTKVEKILAIAAFIGIKNNMILFSEKMSIKPCGVGFPSLAKKITGDILPGVYEESDTAMQGVVFQSDLNIPATYNADPTLPEIPDNVKKLLKDIFVRFGNYKGTTIGLFINEFKDEISKYNILDSKKYIDDKKVYEFFNSDVMYEKYKNNEIVSYIKTMGI